MHSVEPDNLSKVTIAASLSCADDQYSRVS